MVTIQSERRNVTSFDFLETSGADIEKGILNLDKKKLLKTPMFQLKPLKKIGHF